MQEGVGLLCVVTMVTLVCARNRTELKQESLALQTDMNMYINMGIA